MEPPPASCLFTDCFLVIGLILAAVGDHQLAVGRARGVNHLLAFGGRVGHGLFGEHMLAGLESADGVLSVHAVGQHDIDDVHLGIVFDGIVILVVVDILRAHAISQSQLVGFIRVAAD